MWWHRVLRLARPWRIRKDAGELRLRDWQKFPCWEFCFGEEGVPGQTEATMRPYKDARALDLTSFHGGVASTLTLACGRIVSGVFWSGQAEFTRENSDNVEIWLDRPAGKICSTPLPDHWNQIIHDSSWRIGLGQIAKREYLSDERAQSLITLVYQTLNVKREEMWPITVRPSVDIHGWPKSWAIDGWYRAGTQDRLV